MNTLSLAGIIAALSMNYSNPRRVRRAPRKVGKPSGGFGGLNRKNPFRGIACKSPRWPNEERHVEGARDTRPRWNTRHRHEVLTAVFTGDASRITPMIDSNPIPCAFIP